MRELRVETQRAGAALIMTVVAIGCSIPPPRSQNVGVPVLVPAQGAEPNSSQDNVTVTVVPIHAGNYTQFPQINKRVTWQEPTGNRNLLTGAEEFRERHADWILLPLPSFQIAIENRTGHVIRGAGAVVRLRDQAGNSTLPQSKADAAAALVNEVQNAAFLPINSKAREAPRLQLELSRLPFFDSTVEVLPNETWRGYLVFTIPLMSTWSDYETFMASIERLNVVLADLVTETDPAGNPTRRAQFDFRFDRTVQNRLMLCPAEEQPSMDRCRPAEASVGGTSGT